MEPNVDQFQEVFTEFSDVDEDKIEYYMSQAKNEVSSTAFGNSYTHAIYLVMAHSLTVSNENRAGKGTVTSEKAGDLSVNYNTGSNVGDGFDEYRSTQYGNQYILLVKSNVMTVNVI